MTGSMTASCTLGWHPTKSQSFVPQSPVKPEEHSGLNSSLLGCCSVIPWKYSHCFHHNVHSVVKRNTEWLFQITAKWQDPSDLIPNRPFESHFTMPCVSNNYYKDVSMAIHSYLTMDSGFLKLGNFGSPITHFPWCICPWTFILRIMDKTSYHRIHLYQTCILNLHIYRSFVVCN